MSLSLIQGYSSAEEDDHLAAPTAYDFDSDSSGEDAVGHRSSRRPPNPLSYKPLLDPPLGAPASSGLPSAFDAFSEISGPPQFLNNSVEGNDNSRDAERPRGRHGRWKARSEKKELPAGAVLQSKPQLVGVHERVRSDIESNQPSKSSALGTTQDGAKRMQTATNPAAEDAAELLRICLQCGVPKTYSTGKGIVCPICNDRPTNVADKELKKKGSAVKDKEKSKRMKGQSSHATWKSETEMHLRQQFD